MTNDQEKDVALPVADFNCFIDEVEIQKTETTHLTFCYFGLLIPTDKFVVETKAKSVLSIIGKQKFHAHKTYRVLANEIVCETLTNLIMEYRLQALFFPFVRNWLNDPRLTVLRTFQLPELERVKNSNYRSQAWLMFIHVFNAYLTNVYQSKKIRMFFDSDWLRPGEMVVHEGQKLKAIGEMISTTQKDTVLLCLADHLGYLFQKYKRLSFNQDGKHMLHPIKEDDYATKNAVRLFNYLSEEKLFTTLDLWDWIAKENNH